MKTLTLLHKLPAKEIEMHISYEANTCGYIDTWVTVNDVKKAVYTFSPEDLTEEYENIEDMLRDWENRLYDFWCDLP